MPTTTLAPSTFPNFDPATGEIIAEIRSASSEEVGDAVSRARASQPGWAALGFEKRAELLLKCSEALVSRRREFAELITREMGKPVKDAEREVRTWADGMPGVMDEVREALEPEVLQGHDCVSHVVREPLGVVAAITPWNFPVGMPLELLPSALATGNTVVFKPSELVPLSGEKLAELLIELLPRDVLVQIHGRGDVGAELVAADVDMIGFVGSRDTGKAIMKSASGRLKRLVLELGGKDPLVVFGDADLDAAADCAVTHALRNTGQVCCSVERIFVAEEVAERFQDLVVEKAKTWKHGNGFEDGVKMGPMVSAEQREKVRVQVEEARQGGARILLGGDMPGGEGWFYPATVMSELAPELAINHQETFGPVITLARFSGDEEEAVQLANDTPYGLGANVYTGDLERGRRIAERIRAGTVGVNRYLNGATGAPWTGARESGFGFIGSVDGHKQFTIPKTISFPK